MDTALEVFTAGDFFTLIIVVVLIIIIYKFFRANKALKRIIDASQHHHVIHALLNKKGFENALNGLLLSHSLSDYIGKNQEHGLILLAIDDYPDLFYKYSRFDIDSITKSIAIRLSENSAYEDACAYFGSGFFAILLYKSNKYKVETLAKTYRQEILSQKYEADNENIDSAIFISISVAYTTYNCGMPGLKVLEGMKNALRESQESERNQEIPFSLDTSLDHTEDS